MKKYLYLTKHEWCNTWVNGGIIPINPASFYLSPTREGTKTPDENLIHNSPVDIASLSSFGFHMENVKDLTFTNNIYNGISLPSFANADYYKEDGLILSFCNRKSNEICKRLGKIACVAIGSIESLKSIIDEQLGVEGMAGNCQYTQDHQRNHFLKSIEDGWQDEYRLFWPVKNACKVVIPAGLAKKVKLKDFY